MGDLPKDLLDSESLPKYKRDLVAKQKALRAELQALQLQSGHCRLEVSRTEIFEVSIHKIFFRVVKKK
jgi:E3 ubiquitin ligase SMURF1/2